jgi:hypothetical protein
MYVEPSPSAQSTLLLRSLQEIIHNRITQKKREMHPSHNKAYLESLRIEIETLQWILAEILYTLATIISQYLNGLFVFQDHTIIKNEILY